MALVPVSVAPSLLLELQSPGDGDGPRAMDALIETQRQLFHSQVDQLQRLVASQCRLTGVNPLAQEMAAGALSIKIGKKPRDLLNPKAVKNLQSIFSIKDNIGKKELREISANCGVTVTQARDFFNGQRSRVRNIVRLSREKAIELEPSVLGNSNQDSYAGVTTTLGSSSTSHDQAPQITTADAAPVDFVGPTATATDVVPLAVLPPAMPGSTGQVCINPEATSSHSELPAVKLEEDGMKEEDKKFVDDVLALMRRETTFAGQVRLMESVLRINNDAVLNWFIVKEGLAILIAWLGEAAVEEQTSVILTIFKVLCHLPLSKAVPAQISSILQAINRLRFYRTSDISNRAKVLLSKWSKLLRSHLLKKSPNDTQKDLIRKQRIQELLHGQSGDFGMGFTENILALTENGDEKKPEPKRLRLLAAPYNDSTKRNGASISSIKNKEKRRVLLVEHPDRKAAQNTTRVARTAIISNSRPLSADDIQKAKLRASYMQQKRGKTDVLKTESDSKLLAKPDARKLGHVLGSRVVNKPDIDPLNMMERLKHAQVRWRTPPEVRIDPAWQVCTGEKSKECGFQAQRIRREAETFYPDPQKIPPNPKDPWDVEMDFDDSLTPEIPIDQPQDTDPDPIQRGLVQMLDQPSVVSTSTSSQPVVAEAADSLALPEPDLELLAVLLKNPELVFALTSGQSSGLSGEQTVALLDMLKNSGVALSDLVNGSVGSNNVTKSGLVHESVPTSLPSPTPASDRGAWRSEFTTNPTKPSLQAHIPIHNSLPVAAPPVVSSPLVAASSPYGSIPGFNRQSLPINLPSQQFTTHNSGPIGTQMHQTLMNATSVNSIATQNVPNHQIMTALKTEHSVYAGGAQSWAGQPGSLPEVSDPNSRFSHYQNRYNAASNGLPPSGHVVAGPRWNANHSSRAGYSADTWGLQSDPGRTRESSASWGYNEQRRDESGGYVGQRWYGRDHDQKR